MPDFDAVRVRVLLEQLCELEPDWFWHTESGSRIDAKSELGAVSVARIHANGKPTIYVESIRNALEGLHDSKDWFVQLESDSDTNELGEEIRSYVCRIYDPFIGWAAPQLASVAYTVRTRHSRGSRRCLRRLIRH